MKLCYEDVKNWKICLPMLLHFRRNYSEPTELIDIINDERLTIDDLKFGFDYLSMRASPEEFAAYNKRLNIDEQSSPFAYKSTKIINSKIIDNSNQITNSKFVSNSDNVENSQYVLNSNVVKNGIDIYNSKYITNSSIILRSLNVGDSNNIIDSNYIINSIGIAHSTQIDNSYNIIASFNTSNSAFCRNVKNVQNCLFCFGIEDKSYCIFNHEVPEHIFNFTKKQLESYSSFSLDFMTVIRTSFLPIDPKENPMTNWFINYPDSFIEWVTTLPLFNKDLMLQLTLDARFNS